MELADTNRNSRRNDSEVGLYSIAQLACFLVRNIKYIITDIKINKSEWMKARIS
jgi:hypothetical protein